MLMKSRAPRLNKRLIANFDHGIGIVENISASGGFLTTDADFPTDEFFTIGLKVMGCKTIKMNCEVQRRMESGVGFKILDFENSKQDLFHQYIKGQFRALRKFGSDRIFTTEIVITLKDTNVFGNVYFSNFIEYQGIIREKFLLSAVPDLYDMLSAKSIRLVTIDTYNRFLENTYFGDTLLVELTTSAIKASSCKLNITFKNKHTGRIVGSGYQNFCVVKSNGKVIRIPDMLLEPLDFFQEVQDTG